MDAGPFGVAMWHARRRWFARRRARVETAEGLGLGCRRWADGAPWVWYVRSMCVSRDRRSRLCLVCTGDLDLWKRVPGCGAEALYLGCRIQASSSEQRAMAPTCVGLA